MRHILTRQLLLVLLLVAMRPGLSAQPARPWPPGVQPVNEASPALSPDEELQTFHVAPG